MAETLDQQKIKHNHCTIWKYTGYDHDKKQSSIHTKSDFQVHLKWKKMMLSIFWVNICLSKIKTLYKSTLKRNTSNSLTDNREIDSD